MNNPPYKAGGKGKLAKWEYLGITNLLPVYEEIEDGSELMWASCNPRKLKNLERLVRKKNEIWELRKRT